jgi:hypothetical protein
VRLAELLDEQSSQASSTSHFQQSYRPSMAMGEASSAPHRVKGSPRMHFFLFFTWHAHHTKLFGPQELPGFITCTLCVLLASFFLHHPPTAPSHPLHPPVPLIKPREHEKPRRGTRKMNALAHATRLTASQRALIAHFSHSHSTTRSTQKPLRTPKMDTPSSLFQTRTTLCTPKMETPSSSTHSPSLPLHYHVSTVKEEVPPPPLHPSLTTVKEEAPPPVLHPGLNSLNVTAPPLEVHFPTATNLLAPPILKSGEPYYGDGSCIVEEEISSSWQLTGAKKDSTAAEDKGMDKGEERSHSTYHMAEEHLELLFDLRQRQNERVNGQGIINQ